MTCTDGAARVFSTLLLLGGYLVYASANAVLPLASELEDQLGIRAGGGAVLLVPFAVGFGVGVPCWALLTPRWPASRVAVLALAAAAVAGAVMALATAVGPAVAARAALGLAAAGFVPAAQSWLTDSTSASRRGRAVAAFVIAVVTGSFAGQALAGVVAELVGVRVALLVLTAVLPAAVACGLALARRDLPPPSRAAAAPARRPVRALLPVMAVASLTFGTYWMLLSALPAILRADPFGLSPAEAGIVPLLGLLGIAGAHFSGRAVDRRGQREVTCLVLVLGVAALSVTVLAGDHLLAFTVGYGVFLTAYWSFMAPVVAEVAARTSPGIERQAGVRLLYGAMWLGASIAPLAVTVTGTWPVLAATAALAWTLAAVIAGRAFAPRPGVAA